MSSICLALTLFFSPFSSRCGIALDCWMLPIHNDVLEAGVHQPLLFINSSDFQWAENVKNMMKLTYPPQHIGAPSCTILTLKLVTSGVYMYIHHSTLYRRGTSHGNQSDILFLPLFSELWVQFASSLDRNVAFKVNLDICHAFFNRHLLKGILVDFASGPEFNATIIISSPPTHTHTHTNTHTQIHYIYSIFLI